MNKQSQFTLGIIVGLVAVVCMGLTLTNSRRYGEPIAKVQYTQIAPTDTNAVTETAYGLNGLLTRIDVIMSADSNDPNVSITFRDQNNAIVVPDAVLATQDVNQVLVKLARSEKSSPDATFNPVPLSDSDITISATADAGPNDLTIDVILYLE